MRFFLPIVLVIACTLGGCIETNDAPVIESPLLPATVASVLADAGRFRSAPPCSLRSALPGDAIDPIATLAGCWGGATRLPSLRNSGLFLYEVYTFDLDANVFTRWTLIGTGSGDLIPGFAFVTVERGAIDLLDDSSINLVESSLSSVDPLSGDEILNDSPNPPLIRPSTVTISGDGMMFWIDYSAGADTPPPTFLQRLNCP